MGEVRFMISEAAKQVHVESHVLRYWEEELELVIGRTEMGHRYYTEDDIIKLEHIVFYRGLGFSLEQIKEKIPAITAEKKEWSYYLHRRSCYTIRSIPYKIALRPSKQARRSLKPVYHST